MINFLFSKQLTKILLKRVLILFPIMMLSFFILFFSNITFANDGPKPPSRLNAASISAKIIPHLFDYMHYRLTGMCLWWHCHGPFDCGFEVTPELDEYLPDLLVSVYNGRGNDPIFEMSELPTSDFSTDGLAYKTGNVAFNTVVKSTFSSPITANIGNGNAAAEANKSHYDALRTKSVDVIGSPLQLFYIRYLMLRPNTSFYLPYYISDLDTIGRLGLAESLRKETWLPGHYIGGGFLNHWGMEFPRNMNVNVYNDYKASVIVAQRAADIVTNVNTLHTNQSTSNSCGTNCVVSNVIEEQKDDHEIWQEIYPHDRHIHPGESDLSSVSSMGNDDEQAGKGNYIFVVWRHYQGCVQAEGHLVSATHHVGTPQKR